MIRKRIAGTPYDVSCICLGTAEFGSVMPKDDAFEMLDVYASSGGNFLDTALDYGSGASERTIGEWLRSRGMEDKVVVATKGGCPVEGARHVPRLSRAEIDGDLRQSLRNLGTDCIDIYYLHRDDPTRAVEDFVDQLEGYVAQGLIRHYGLSNWKLPRLRQAHACAGESGHLAVSEVLWSLANPNMDAIADPSVANMDAEMRAFHERTNLAAAPYTAQARGYFSKLRDGDVTKAQDWVLATYHSEENMNRLTRAKRLAAQMGCALEAVALAYLTNQPFPTTPIISARNNEQLQLSLGAADLILTREQIDYLEHGEPEMR